jgi:predicted transcriptional regulator
MATLKQHRKRVGLGLRQFARHAGVNKDIVLRIEKRLTDPANVNYGDIVRIVRTLQRAGLPDLKVEDIFPVKDVAA